MISTLCVCTPPPLALDRGLNMSNMNGAASSSDDTKENAQQQEFVPEESVALTQEEVELMAKIKDHFEKLDNGYILNDTLVLKFVRGYHYETPRFEKTVAFLERALIFRKEQRVDFIVEEKGEDETKFRRSVWPYHIHGRDKRGHPVYYEQIGRVDPETVMKHYALVDVKMYHCVSMERLEAIKAEISEKSGHRTYKHVVILDLAGFGFKHCSKKLYAQINSMVDIYQYFYPEALVRLFIINAPFVFKALWAVVSPWLHPATREQISFCKSGKHLAELTKYIDVDQIPVHYGGKCPGCEACDEKHFGTFLPLGKPPKEVIPGWKNTEVKLPGESGESK